ncbi:BTAD domain-containing putative transcriptional regulator [Kitasatospora sp. NPDC050467]|uniref:BTAD domain-containing putative transcriptional regulator n=1 Tax=Kitasatospora sp. NPDC050467 TaxID=3364053 RepID=UPI0037AECF22
MLELRIRLLGGFRARVGPREIAADAWRLRKPRNLVKLLALAPGHRLHRSQVLAALWPEVRPEAGAGLLRTAVHEARHTLDPDPDPAAGRRYLESGESLALHGGPLRVDVQEFEQAALHARRSRDPDAYERAVARYGGDLLPEDRYEEWAVEREQALHAEYLALLVELGALREARADLDGAAAVLRRAVAADPLHEEASPALMRVYALAGRRHEALHEYDRLSAALDHASDGAEGPGPAAQRLREQVRTGGDVRAELAGELWEHVGDQRMAAGDTAGAAAAYGSALDPGVVDLPASPGVLTGRAADGTGLRAVRLHRKAATAHLAGEAPVMALLAGEAPATAHLAGEAATAAEPHLAGVAAAEPHLAAAETALAEAGGDPAETGRLLSARADWLRASGRYEEARRAAEAGLTLARDHGTADDLTAAHEALATVHHLRGDWPEVLRSEIDRFGAAADEDARLARIFDIHCCLSQYHLYGDGLGDSVEEYARHTVDLAIARGARRAEAFAWCLLGESLLLRGRWDEVPGCLERSAHLHEELGGRGGALPWQRLAEYAAGRGDSAEAAACLRKGMAVAVASPSARHTVGRLHATAALDAVERGEPGEAVRAALAAAASAARHGECPTCTALLHPVAAEAFAALGDADGAAEHAEAARRVAARSDSSAWRAMAQSALGSLASARDDPEGARAHHVAAAGLYGRARQPYWAARAKAQAAAVAVGAGTGEADRRLRAEAAALFETLGARRALARVRESGQAAGQPAGWVTVGGEPG